MSVAAVTVDRSTLSSVAASDRRRWNRVWKSAAWLRTMSFNVASNGSDMGAPRKKKPRLPLLHQRHLQREACRAVHRRGHAQVVRPARYHQGADRVQAEVRPRLGQDGAGV